MGKRAAGLFALPPAVTAKHQPIVDTSNEMVIWKEDSISLRSCEIIVFVIVLLDAFISLALP